MPHQATVGVTLLPYRSKLIESHWWNQWLTPKIQLRSYSEKMLMGVVTRYGKDSLQYVQAGGTPRKRTVRKSVSSTTTTAIASATAPSMETNGNGARVTVS